MVLAQIVVSTVLISLLALSGVFTLASRGRVSNRTLLLMVGFSAGALLGGAFLHLIPEAVQKSTDPNVFNALAVSFLFFFLFERLVWRHCHRADCEVHPFAYMNLMGDALHNFIDGLVIAASFLTSPQLGLVTSIAIALHEIPQEIGDFGVLVYAGMRIRRALLMNFAVALTVIAGGLTGYALSSAIGPHMILLLPFTAGGFIYIAASDLIPELHRAREAPLTAISFSSLSLGLFLMFLVKMAFAK